MMAFSNFGSSMKNEKYHIGFWWWHRNIHLS